RGHEHPQSGQQVQLAHEPACTVPGDDPFLRTGARDRLDGPGEHDEEVVAGIALAVEVLAGGHTAPGAENLEFGDLTRAQLARQRGVVDHGWLGLCMWPASSNAVLST